MSYTVTSLNTVSECDSVTALATKAKNSLLYKQGVIQHKQAGFIETTAAITTELAGINAQITVYEALDETLAEGPAKDENFVKLEGLNHRKFVLTQKQKDNGSIALLESEMDFSLNEKQVAELDVLIAAIADRKATL